MLIKSMLIGSMIYTSVVARMLESEEAARRLGVKRSTLYAYVSRGQIPSHRSADGRRSLFLAEDVEALAKRARGGRSTETRLATVTTGVTALREGEGPLYRGRRATDLAVTAPYEEVAELLWGGPAVEAAMLPWSPASLHPPPGLLAADRLRWAVVMAGAQDPLRADLRPEAVVAVARRLVATMASVLPPPRHGRTGPAPLSLPGRPPLDEAVAVTVAARLVAEPTAAVVRAVNAAMVLLADHELATSTVGVRVAASARADPDDAVLTGLGVVAGPLHGGASQLAYALLRDAQVHGPEQALNETLRWQRRLPGFGHSIYVGEDPRFAVLRRLVADLGQPDLPELLSAVVDLATDRGIPGPNVDLGLAALALATGMPEDAGRTLFTLARVAGWTAHYLEELDERPIRYRLRGVYASRD